MTGITRVSKESIFSDLNNLKVVTTTSDEYATVFGFTEPEVFAALEECGLAHEKAAVKRWYDGFIFGKHKDIYNPWSIINFWDTGNNQLNGNEKAVWSLLLTSGYLKVLSVEDIHDIPEATNPKYELALANLEIGKVVLDDMMS